MTPARRQQLHEYALDRLRATNGDVAAVFDGLVAYCRDIDQAADIARRAWYAWRPTGLTLREREILILLAGGYEYKDIADKLIISRRTVQTHIGNIIEEFEAINAAHAVIKALKAGVIHLDQIEPLKENCKLE